VSNAAGEIVTLMLSNRYRNVTTNCQEGEYKVIFFTSIAFNLKKLIQS